MGVYWLKMFGGLGKPVTSKNHMYFIQEMETNTVCISNTVYCIQIFPLEALTRI